MHYLFVLLALGALLVVHELGHWVAARLLGVRVPRFTIGFGPPLLSFQVGGTQFVVGAVPLGAAAHLQGMNPHRADAAEAAGYGTRGPGRRLFIILAGPLANYAVALGILFALYTSGTHVVVPLTVGTVLPGSEAARAQLLPGDRILSVDGRALEGWSDFVERVAERPGRALELGVERHGEPRTVTVRPRPDERGAGRIGVSQQYVFRAHAPGEALKQAFVHTGRVASEGVSTLVALVRGPDAARPGALVRQESSDVASSDVDALLRALVAASVALALLTLLPVPGLDGGRVLLLLIEAVSGRRLPPRLETLAHTTGFLAIAAAILVMAGAEIRRALPAPSTVAPVQAAVVTPDGGTGTVAAVVTPDGGTGTVAAVAPDAGTVAPGGTAPRGGGPGGTGVAVASQPAPAVDAGAAAGTASSVPPSATGSGTPAVPAGGVAPASGPGIAAPAPP